LAACGAAWVIFFLAVVCAADAAGAVTTATAVSLRVLPGVRDAGLVAGLGAGLVAAGLDVFLVTGLVAALPADAATLGLATGDLGAADFGLTSRASDSATRFIVLVGFFAALVATGLTGADLAAALLLGAAFFAAGNFAVAFFTMPALPPALSIARMADGLPAGAFAAALAEGLAAGFLATLAAFEAVAGALAEDRSEAFTFVATVEALEESSLSTSGRVL